MRAPLEVEKAIEREKITAYVVSHLPIVKAYAVKIAEVSPKLKHNYHATMRSSVSMKYFFKDLG